MTNVRMEENTRLASTKKTRYTHTFQGFMSTALMELFQGLLIQLGTLKVLLINSKKEGLPALALHEVKILIIINRAQLSWVYSNAEIRALSANTLPEENCN